MERPVPLDVLVVGGRTTGLMLAIRLRRQGLKVRIIDRSLGIDPNSRATLLHSRSLELLDGLGLAEEILAKGQDLRGMRIFREGRLVLAGEDPPVDSPFPFGIAFSQVKIERLLAAKLSDLGVKVERNTQLVDLGQDERCVWASLSHSDGRAERVEASWLVGCDGAHSATRHLLGIGFSGSQSRYSYILGDVRAEAAEPANCWFYLLHDEGYVVFAILDEGRRQIFANLPLGHPAEGKPTLAELQDLVDRRGGSRYRMSDPRWLTYFQIHYRLAERYRKGRVFLAGDAAHLNSLVGGHGMNTGLQDACNLSWKLALATKGGCSEALLDSYEAERRPVAAAMIEGSRTLTEPGEKYPQMSEAERQALVESFQMSPEALWLFRREFEELDLDYGTSPLCHDAAPDLPAALRPGLEAQNVSPLLLEGKERDLFHLLGGPKHCLLLFAGSDLTVATAEDFARSLLARYAAWIGAYLVLGQAVEESSNQTLPLLLDPKGQLAQRYGVEAGGLYLIRPDGYVAFRATDLERLSGYLDQVLPLG